MYTWFLKPLLDIVARVYCVFCMWCVILDSMYCCVRYDFTFGVYCRSRLQTLFQQLEKIGGKQARNQTSTEDLQTIRYVTSKIHQILNSQGRPSPPTNTHPHPLIIADPNPLPTLIPSHSSLLTLTHTNTVVLVPTQSSLLQHPGRAFLYRTEGK